MISNKISSLLFILLIGCNTKNTDLMGKYQTYKPSYPDKVYRYFIYESWSTGTSLELKEDSTFVLKNCSMNIKGQWHSDSDSLYLKINSKRFLTDSLNYSPKWKHWLEIGKGTYNYQINGNFLEIEKTTPEGKLSLEKLEKMTP